MSDEEADDKKASVEYRKKVNWNLGQLYSVGQWTMDKAEQNGLDKEGALSDVHVVFQCESCHSILGDATNWIAADETLESFSLSAVTECVTVGETLHHSVHAHDAGSSYFSLTCTNCKEELGRRYITTPSHLDHLRDHFTLHVAMVTSYQLGSAKVKGMSEGKGQEPALLLRVWERCMKLQHLVLNLNERLDFVERFLQDTDNPPVLSPPQPSVDDMADADS